MRHRVTSFECLENQISAIYCLSYSNERSIGRRRGWCASVTRKNSNLVAAACLSDRGCLGGPKVCANMNTLIVEDDFTSRLLLQRRLKIYGPCDVAVNGEEAVEAVRIALASNGYYDLICLDILMPKLDGQATLKHIRAQEEANGIWSTHGAKIIMTTGLNTMKDVRTAFNGLCDAYLVKPIETPKLLEALRNLKLIKLGPATTAGQLKCNS